MQIEDYKYTHPENPSAKPEGAQGQFENAPVSERSAQDSAIEAAMKEIQEAGSSQSEIQVEGELEDLNKAALNAVISGGEQAQTIIKASQKPNLDPEKALRETLADPGFAPHTVYDQDPSNVLDEFYKKQE